MKKWEGVCKRRSCERRERRKRYSKEEVRSMRGGEGREGLGERVRGRRE